MAGVGRYSDIDFSTLRLSSNRYQKLLTDDEKDYLKKKYDGYNNILALKYIITDTDYNKAHPNDEKVIKNGKEIYYRDLDDDNVDYDVQTGNIHPSKNYLGDQQKDNKYKQIALATQMNTSHTGVHKGDKIKDKKELEKYASYYYPMIKIGTEKDEKLQIILKKIFEEITK